MKWLYKLFGVRGLLPCAHKTCRLVQYQYVMAKIGEIGFESQPMNISILAQCKQCLENVGGVVANSSAAWIRWGVVVEDPPYASADDYMDEHDGKMPGPIVATPDSLPETF